MSKKGLSFDQKKEVLLGAMLASGTIHNMQEVESLGKRNRIIPQAIKEVVEALLAERTICLEKVGTQNIYWAFPSQRKAALLAQRDALHAELLDAQAKRQTAEDRRSDCRKQATLPEAARAATLREAREAQTRTEAVRAELSRLQRTDPTRMAAQIKELKEAKRWCDLWTDNIFVIRQKLGPSEMVDHQFGIPPNFDYA